MLKKIESTMPRVYKSLGIFTCSKNEEYDYRMLSDNIGYLRVTEESTDYLSDTISYVTGNHSTAREMFREDLRELRAQGMTKLVIDIRNNAGGSDEISTVLKTFGGEDYELEWAMDYFNKTE